MDNLRFASPLFLLLLIAVPLAAAWVWRRGAPSAALPAGTLAPALASPRTWRVRLQPALFALRLLGVALLVTALARPQSGEAGSETEAEGIDIVLAFDVSSSMSQPFARNESRLDAAKDVLTQFLDTRESDRVGLVIFKGASLTMSPLTTDYAAVKQGVDIADLVGLKDGTAIGVAMGESVNVLRDSRAATRIVILMTDGENNVHEVEPLTAARLAERLGVRVYTVGVVSPGLTPARSTLNVDEAALREIAEVTGGTYSRAEDQQTLREIYERIDELETSRLAGKEFTRFDELAPFLLAAAAAAIALEVLLRHSLFRRLS